MDSLGYLDYLNNIQVGSRALVLLYYGEAAEYPPKHQRWYRGFGGLDPTPTFLNSMW